MEIDSCVFTNIQGRVIQTQGTSVYVENTRISELKGEFCCAACLELVNGEEILPTVEMQHCIFENCVYSTDVKYKDKIHTSRWNYSYEHKGENDPEIIVCEDALSAEFNDMTFTNCNIRCIRVDAWRFSPVCKVRKCQFRNDYQDLQFDEYDHYPYTLMFHGVDLLVEECIFDHIDGVYTHCQYSPATISNCRFIACGSKEKTALLYCWLS